MKDQFGRVNELAKSVIIRERPISFSPLPVTGLDWYLHLIVVFLIDKMTRP